MAWKKMSQESAAAAALHQSRLTLCPTDGSPPGFPIPGILRARALEWVAISFSNAWKWKVKVKSLSHVWLLATPWTAAYQAPLVHGIFQARLLEWGAIAFSHKSLINSLAKSLWPTRYKSSEFLINFYLFIPIFFYWILSLVIFIGSS